MMEKLFCSIYKSQKKSGAYIYVAKEDGLSRVPQTLLDLLGETELFTHMVLHDNKKLANADVIDVIRSIKEKSFYLQITDDMPEYRSFVANNNEKIIR